MTFLKKNVGKGQSPFRHSFCSAVQGWNCQGQMVGGRAKFRRFWAEGFVMDLTQGGLPQPAMSWVPDKRFRGAAPRRKRRSNRWAASRNFFGVGWSGIPRGSGACPGTGIVGGGCEGDGEARLETPHVVSYAREGAWRWDWGCRSRARVGAMGGMKSRALLVRRGRDTTALPTRLARRNWNRWSRHGQQSTKPFSTFFLQYGLNIHG
jgi:hypothetical protein